MYKYFLVVHLCPVRVDVVVCVYICMEFDMDIFKIYIINMCIAY